MTEIEQVQVDSAEQLVAMAVMDCALNPKNMVVLFAKVNADDLFERYREFIDKTAFFGNQRWTLRFKNESRLEVATSTNQLGGWNWMGVELGGFYINFDQIKVQDDDQLIRMCSRLRIHGKRYVTFGERARAEDTFPNQADIEFQDAVCNQLRNSIVPAEGGIFVPAEGKIPEHLSEVIKLNGQIENCLWTFYTDAQGDTAKAKERLAKNIEVIHRAVGSFQKTGGQSIDKFKRHYGLQARTPQI